ncbi:MAG: hypothetical protein ATN35_02005 [Epulopiscium sp. Nele67-Bin004]|nr:MAG: hypothetical protein ATN35_02005 [Epulopiscium sp. Nele67-Bin004]
MLSIYHLLAKTYHISFDDYLGMELYQVLYLVQLVKQDNRIQVDYELMKQKMLLLIVHSDPQKMWEMLDKGTE